MKILAISNQKGGVAKTTLSVHLAYAAHEKGLRVLLVDFDPQQNAGMSFEPADESQDFLKTHDLFTDTSKPVEFVKDRLAIIRASEQNLVNISLNVNEQNLLIKLPALALKTFENDFDVCIMDTPPAKGILLDSALVAANQVLTPVKMGKYELSGFADLLNNIRRIRNSGLNPRLKHIGSIPMKINTRSSDQMSRLDNFRTEYGKAVLPLMISEREAVQMAVNQGQPVWVKVKGLSHKRTADEWRGACDFILNILTA